MSCLEHLSGAQGSLCPEPRAGLQDETACLQLLQRLFAAAADHGFEQRTAELAQHAEPGASLQDKAACLQLLQRLCAVVAAHCLQLRQVAQHAEPSAGMQDKTAFLQLLQRLFAVVADHRFEQLMVVFGVATGEGPAQLPVALGLLRGMLYGPRADVHREVLLELLLTLPARCAGHAALGLCTLPASCLPHRWLRVKSVCSNPGSCYLRVLICAPDAAAARDVHVRGAVPSLSLRRFAAGRPCCTCSPDSLQHPLLHTLNSVCSHPQLCLHSSLACAFLPFMRDPRSRAHCHL